MAGEGGGAIAKRGYGRNNGEMWRWGFSRAEVGSERTVAGARSEGGRKSGASSFNDEPQRLAEAIESHRRDMVSDEGGMSIPQPIPATVNVRQTDRETSDNGNAEQEYKRLVASRR